MLRSSRGLKEKPWVRDELNVLQLDFMDRHVAKIAGKTHNPFQTICMSDSENYN